MYTDHTIVYARNAEDLNTLVAQNMATGWQPFQEVTIAPDGLLMQPMVKGGDSAITAYLAVAARNITDMLKMTSALVSDGWQPFHEVAFAKDGLMIQVVIKGDPGTGGGGGDDVTWGTLPGKPPVIAAGADAEAARQAIGAGTSNLELGDTAGTAKAGNWTPSWDDIGDKPTVIAAGATAEAARSAIGAGTSDLVVGTSAQDAKAGNWLPSWDDVQNKPDIPDQGAAVADATDESDVVPQLNALLAALRAAGVIAS